MIERACVSRNPLSESVFGGNSCCSNVMFFRADTAQVLLRWLRVVVGSLVGDEIPSLLERKAWRKSLVKATGQALPTTSGTACREGTAGW